jgi:uncharacterized protein
MSLRFEWHDKKAIANKRKHGIAFEEASTVFGDSYSMTIYDPAHSVTEERFITIGMSDKHRLIVVVHTDRHNTIRIISAHKAVKNEIKQYERD